MEPTDYAEDVVVPRLSFGVENLSEVRLTVQVAAEHCGLAAEAVARFVQAVSEALANAIRHGGSDRWFLIRKSAHRLRAEVHDSGNSKALIVPEQTPSPDQLNGRGLWLMSQLADRLEFKTTGGTTVGIEARLRS